MTCFDCEHARFCELWGEIKCIKTHSRIYKIKGDETCEVFSKRAKGSILDAPCQCDECLATRGEED